MKKVYLTFLLILSILPALQAQSWQVYDCSVLPDVSAFAFVTSNVAGDPAINTILDDPFNPGNKMLELISPGEDPGKFMWRYNLPNDANDPITFVIRLKASRDTLDRTMELDFEQGGFRERLYLKNDNTWELKQMAKKGNLPVNIRDWHIIRISKDGDTVNFYLDENPVPVANGTTTTTDANNYFRIGDGNGGSTLGGLVDWMVWDTTGAYAPGEGLALPDTLVMDVPAWVIYDGDQVPDVSDIPFSESNVAGDPATNIILEDPDHAGNQLLELISPGADPGKFMWKHDFPNGVNDPLTLVARIKGVSDTLDRSMELDIQQAGYRERLYLKMDNTWELKETGTKGNLPVGTLGWHIFRMTKVGDSVDVYIDENPVPFVSGKSKTTATANYFRFGDGNGGSTLGGLIDWIIWDTTGTYAPGRGMAIPDSLVAETASSVSSLSDLTISTGILTPEFHPDSLEYHLGMEKGTMIVTLAGTPADEQATVSGDGDFTVFPDTAEIVVTAEDGLKTTYTIYVSADLPFIPRWMVYEADVVPGVSELAFVQSNVAGDPATNVIVEDPDHAGNNILELISPGADPGKFMWKHDLPNSVNDSLTLVARIKGVSDTLDRTMEFDIQQAGFRERLYLKNDNTWELKETGVKGDLPIGLQGWHVFRMVKMGDSTDVYIDENPVPFVSGKSKSSSLENYFRFGDGNGSSTLGALVDWIIWDTLGAYAPGEGLPLPDSLIAATASSVSTLSELLVSAGTMEPAFHADSLEYNIDLAPLTETVILTATPADTMATVTGDGEFTSFPDTVEIVVTSEDGLATTYTVYFSAVPAYVAKWMVYDADVTPDVSDLLFTQSNVAGDPATNVILADTDNPGNNLLELISPGADPGKFMWKYTFPNSVNDSVTLVARVKGVSDTLDRTMEFDLQQAGFRERLYLKNDNTWELKETGVKGNLPVGVMGWHIFRIAKMGDSVDVYIDENPVPFVSGKSQTTTTENYFRFGDGNGSSTLGGLVDWIIWDTTGAYAPESTGLEIPDTLVTTTSSSDASLSALVPSVGSLSPAFDPDVLDYDLVLPEGTTSVTLTATPNDVLATVAGDGEYTKLPSSEQITVTAQDGLKWKYNLNITVESTSDASLSALVPDVGNLAPPFDAAVLEYDLVLPTGTTSVTLTATPNDPLATVEGDGEFTTFPVTAEITVTAQNGSQLVYNVNITVEPSGINDLAGKLVRVYPNPVSDYLNIEFADAASSVYVYDVLGKLVYQKSDTGYRIALDVTGFSKGIYYLRVISGQETAALQVIIE
jgi:hypothetical protein